MAGLGSRQYISITKLLIRLLTLLNFITCRFILIEEKNAVYIRVYIYKSGVAWGEQGERPLNPDN